MSYNGTIHVNFPDHGMDLGRGSRMKYRRAVSLAEFESYVSELKASGAYRVFQENTIGENRYVTLISDEGMLHLYYTASEECVRIVSDTLEYFTLPVDESEGYEKVTDTTFCVMSLDYTHREVTDGNGMSYVIILEDGRFIIMDGGYRQDAARLYKFLSDNNKRADGRIVIAAWYMSHSHGDHHGCFNEFTKLYADQVTLQYWIANPGQAWMFNGGYSSWLTDVAPEELKAYGDVKWIRPHTGQKVRFCDVTLEFLYTLEDYIPATLTNMNDSSTVTRMTVKGQTVLFMGDCEKTASAVIVHQQGEGLKSDFVQVNHHGYSGGATLLYQAIAPTYSLWCTSEIAFRFRTCGIKYQWIGNAVSSNKYIYDTVGAENCFVADGPVKMIRMPLTDKETDITYYSFD
jgi:beta-lactamase superfamily II metal-dependent hydrolase